jgi:hypothetical protein
MSSTLGNSNSNELINSFVNAASNRASFKFVQRLAMSSRRLNMLSHLTGGGSLENIENLHNEIFCLKQERNFFKEKYTDQLNDIQDLQDAVKRGKNEIDRLRDELIKLAQQSREPPTEDEDEESPAEMDTHSHETDVSGASVDGANSETTKELNRFKLENIPEEDGSVTTTEEDYDDDATDDDESSEGGEENAEEDNEMVDIRANAAKMLIWANYQCSRNSQTVMPNVVQEESPLEAREETPGTARG